MDGVIIKKLKCNFAQYLVFSISSDSPMFYLEEIKEQMILSEGDVVIFDQLLQTGNSDNRFLAMTFSNGVFDFSSIHHLDKDNVAIEVKNEVSNYLRNNTLLLKYSILLGKQKEIILNGGSI